MNLLFAQQMSLLPVNLVHASLTIASTRDGMTTVGWRLVNDGSDELIALGCLPPCTRQDLGTRSSEVQIALLQAVATLHDWPPFD